MKFENNEPVVELLRGVLNEAETEGRINRIAIVYGDGTNIQRKYLALSGAPEYEVYTQLNNLAFDVLMRLRQYELNESKMRIGPRTQVNHVAYHMEFNFDFLTWLVTQEMRRVKLGAPPLKVALVVPAGVKHYNDQMLHNVCLPMIDMIGGEPVVDVDDTFLWSRTNCFRELVEMTNEGLEVPRLRPNEDAVKTMSEAGLDGCITITLREASYNLHRNSDVEVWKQVGDWLQELGQTVVYVRDTAKAEESLPGCVTVPIASKSLQHRAALYKRAKLNLFVSNGPCVLDWFCCDTPSVTVITIGEDDGLNWCKPEWWMPNHGINCGDQFPFFKGTQKKILWDKQSLPAIQTAVRDLL